jgi:hypothetical protein
MKTCFVTHVSDDWYDSVGASKLVASARYFHPEIPFFVYGTQEINQLFQIHPNVNWNTLQPFTTLPAFENEEGIVFDMVVHFDADSMIVGKLDELLSEDNLKYDVIGVRNNNDFDKAGKDGAITQERIPIQEYINAGLVGCTSKKFLQTWTIKNISEGNNQPFQEQSVLNSIIGEYNYKLKILDPKESNVHYGISGLFGTNTHWDSWKEISLNGNKELILRNKFVKVLHHVGGHQKNKLDFNIFSQEVAERLYEIIR